MSAGYSVFLESCPAVTICCVPVSLNVTLRPLKVASAFMGESSCVIVTGEATYVHKMLSNGRHVCRLDLLLTDSVPLCGE